MQQNLILEAEKREELGKNANRRLRAAGRIPAVIYGRKVSPIPLSVDPREIHRILHLEAGQNTIFKLKVGADTLDVLIRDYQLDPVSGKLLHADLQAVLMDEAMTFEVPVEIVGTAPGVKEGGILDVVLREIEIECLPGDVPDHIKVDVSQLAIGQSIRIEDLKLASEKIRVLSEPDLVVCTVAAPHVVEEEVEVAEPELEAPEPEVIKRGKAEEEEGEGE